MYNLFWELIYQQLFNNDSYTLSDINMTIGSYSCNFSEYITSLIALICTITVYVICCLCVWKVIRLFGRLWSRF